MPSPAFIPTQLPPAGAAHAMNSSYREFTDISADGLALFCREYTAPTPQGDVVCLPGLTRNSQDFARLAQHLAGRYRVLTPDLRGRGRSQWDPHPANYHPVTYPDLDAAAWEDYARASYRQGDDGRVIPDYDPAIGDMLRASPPASLDMWPVWAMIRQPVLAIRGATSDILSTTTVTRMLQEMPSLAHVEVPARGHVPLLNEPGVTEHIDAFLARVLR